ncbi:MAG: hypothetical protein Q9227_000013 [Pyrenula ochraceoflavens]
MYVADGWFCALFIGGMLLCDLDLLAAKDELPQIFSTLKPYKSYIFYTLFAISNYLGGIPSHSFDMNVFRKSFGWYYLSFLKPQAVFDYKWFYLFWAATFLVASIPRIPWLKRFFEIPFNQYLARISFSLYLVHGPVLWTLGDRIYAAVGWSKESNATRIPGWINLFPLPKLGPFGLEVSFLLPQLILLPFTLWIAEISTRLIDEPSNRFVHWFSLNWKTADAVFSCASPASEQTEDIEPGSLKGSHFQPPVPLRREEDIRIYTLHAVNSKNKDGKTL